jgi:hypothetical protein
MLTKLGWVVQGKLQNDTPQDLAIVSTKIWYLSHFPVANLNKIPVKRRRVFDAAAKTGGVSLNSVLCKGPDNLTSMLGVLYRFRQKQIAVIADIREMYSQILIKKRRPTKSTHFMAKL